MREESLHVQIANFKNSEYGVGFFYFLFIRNFISLIKRRGAQP